MMVTPSKLSVIRKVAALARARPTLLLSWTEKAVWRKWNWPRLSFVYYESRVELELKFFGKEKNSKKEEKKTKKVCGLRDIHMRARAKNRGVTE